MTESSESTVPTNGHTTNVETNGKAQSHPPKSFWKQRWAWGALAILVAIALFSLLMVARIVTSDASLARPTLAGATPNAIVDQASGDLLVNADLLIQANERLVQTIQWTIGLVITVAALLVGFSWFQGRLNLHEDRETLRRHAKDLQSQFDARSSEVEEQLQTVESLKETVESELPALKKLGIDLLTVQESQADHLFTDALIAISTTRELTTLVHQILNYAKQHPLIAPPANVFDLVTRANTSISEIRRYGGFDRDDLMVLRGSYGDFSAQYVRDKLEDHPAYREASDQWAEHLVELRHELNKHVHGAATDERPKPEE